MTRDEYHAYLRSPQWHTLRRVMLDQADGRCQVCRRVERLQVHHNTYDRVGHERLSDLIVLCRQCHERHHFGVAAPWETAAERDVLMPLDVDCPHCHAERGAACVTPGDQFTSPHKARYRFSTRQASLYRNRTAA